MMVIIKVYDYGDHHNWNPDKAPKEMVVNASCVGGEDGIMAFFPYPDNPNLMGIAHGDDGNWWFIGTCSNDWVSKIIDALKVYKRDPVVKKRTQVETAHIKVSDEGISLDICKYGECIEQCGCIKYNENTPKDLKTLLQNMHCKIMYVVLEDGNSRASNKVLLSTKVNGYKDRVKKDCL
jgi:hypothetical protein